MRRIVKDQIETLERRQAFLEQRLEERKEYSGDSYDVAEVEALKTAVWNLKFIKEHPSVQHRIEQESSLEEIFELSKEVEEI